MLAVGLVPAGGDARGPARRIGVDALMSRWDDDRTVAIDRPKPDEGRMRKNHASLIVLDGAEIGRDFRLRKRSMVLGRSPEADIRVLDNGASRAHARIDRAWNPLDRVSVYGITDLGSTNRTFVNSALIDRVQLEDGDKIQIGDTVLKFVILDDIEATFHSEIRDRITYDQLTGLLTKESLFLACEMELKRCVKFDLPLSVLMMDLDFFKSVNDNHGHLMGSHVLSEVGRLIRESVREADLSGRYGGEEFVTYLAETDAMKARLVAERVRKTIQDHPFTLGDLKIHVNISIGVAAAPGDGRDLRTLVDIADRALYRAKETGRNKVCVAGSPA